MSDGRIIDDDHDDEDLGMVKPLGGLRGSSWGPLGGLLGASWGPIGGLFAVMLFWAILSLFRSLKIMVHKSVILLMFLDPEANFC